MHTQLKISLFLTRIFCPPRSFSCLFLISLLELYQFRGSWQLNSSPNGLTINKGQDYEPDLILEIAEEDFQVLLEGNLPYNALLPWCRVRLEVYLSLARVLSEILG